MRSITNPKKRIKAHNKVVGLIESEPEYLPSLVDQYIEYIRKEHGDVYEGVEDEAMKELLYAGMRMYTTMPNVGVLEIDSLVTSIRTKKLTPFLQRYFSSMVNTIWKNREPTMERQLAHGLAMAGFEIVGRTYDAMRLVKL